MQHIYEYFLKNRLYSNFKFFRVMKIKRFLELRPFYKHPENSPEYKLYHAFMTEFFKHLNEHKPLPAYLSPN
jgi:RecB family exonuclease